MYKYSSTTLSLKEASSAKIQEKNICVWIPWFGISLHEDLSDNTFNRYQDEYAATAHPDSVATAYLWNKGT